MSRDYHFGLIPAAGKGMRFGEISNRYPKCLLPYKGKPILLHNIETLLEAGCDDVYVVVNYGKDKIAEMIKFFAQSDINLMDTVHFIVYEGDDGPGGSIIAGMSAAGSSGVCTILLSDILPEREGITGNISELREDKLGIKIVDDPRRWCMVDTNNHTLFDKPNHNPQTPFALSGVYHIADVKRYVEIHEEKDRDSLDEEYQISHVLRTYMKERIPKYITFPLTDFGTLSEYLDNRDVSTSRSFNELVLGDESVIKYSFENPEKMYRESSWMSALPPKLRHITPEIYSYSGISYEMERIDYPTLRELFVYADNSLPLWENIIEKCFSVIGDFRSTKIHSASSAQFPQEVIDRIGNRIVEGGMIGEDEYTPFLKDLQRELMQNKEVRETHVYHGDLCMSNIFMDIDKMRVKLIDPRGEMYGNFIYDLAKLYHSFVCMYDIVDTKMYVVNGTMVKLYTRGKSKISERFVKRLKEEYGHHVYLLVRYLTAGLFASMIPLHADEPINQCIYLYIHRYILHNLRNGYDDIILEGDWIIDISEELKNGNHSI